MMATSHAVTGAAIALIITEPVLALPLAFVSHFVCDALPHIGLDEYGGHHKKPRLFHKILLVDTTLLTCFFVFLLVNSAPALVYACVFLAGAPDLVWAYRYGIQEKLGRSKARAKSAFSRFHSKIQWSQTLRGSYFELPFSLTLLFMVTEKI